MCMSSILLNCTIMYILKMNSFSIMAMWKMCYLIFYILSDIFVFCCQIFFYYSSLGARKWPLWMTFTKDATSLNYLVSTNVTKIIEKNNHLREEGLVSPHASRNITPLWQNIWNDGGAGNNKNGNGGSWLNFVRSFYSIFALPLWCVPHI